MNVQRPAYGVRRSASSLAALDYSVLQQCMHCGLCLPVCPTFAETGRERHSPRGRISLMRAIADGELEMSHAFAEEMSYCLGCLACTSACPAGVDYAHMLETAREEVEHRDLLRVPARGFIRWFTMRFLFVHPWAMRAAGRTLWLYQASGLQWLVRKLRLTAVLPRRIRELEPATPTIRARFSDQLIAEIESARVERRFRVALLTGCVADLVLPEINRATVDVLIENGCEVFTPRAQHCCGSLHEHNGDLTTARRLARTQIDTIDPFAFDAIISNAGGCGSHLKHYDRLLADDDAYVERAREWVRKLKDVSEWLVEIGFRPPRPPDQRRTPNAERLNPNAQHPAASFDPATNIKEPASRSERPPANSLPVPAASRPDTGDAVERSDTSTLDVQRSAFAVRDRSAAVTPLTYHESCHLCHGQKLSAQPRAILRALPGFELRECAEATWCCGSAGIYNITQPATAAWLQQRKVGHLHATGASVVATANPGCHLHIANGLRASGDAITRVVHPVVLLAEAYRRERA